MPDDKVAVKKEDDDDVVVVKDEEDEELMADEKKEDGKDDDVDDDGDMPLKDIKKPTDTDVLSGRGGAAQRHPGNQTYRRLVALNRGLYATCLKSEKLKISRSIVQAIRSQGGRFLEKSSKTGLWNDVGDRRAMEKTSQALREGQPRLKQRIGELAAATEDTQIAAVAGGGTMQPSSLDVDPGKLLPAVSESESTVLAGNMQAANLRHLSTSSVDTLQHVNTALGDDGSAAGSSGGSVIIPPELIAAGSRRGSGNISVTSGGDGSAPVLLENIHEVLESADPTALAAALSGDTPEAAALRQSIRARLSGSGFNSLIGNVNPHGQSLMSGASGSVGYHGGSANSLLSEFSAFAQGGNPPNPAAAPPTAPAVASAAENISTSMSSLNMGDDNHPGESKDDGGATPAAPGPAGGSGATPVSIWDASEQSDGVVVVSSSPFHSTDRGKNLGYLADRREYFAKMKRKRPASATTTNTSNSSMDTATAAIAAGFAGAPAMGNIQAAGLPYTADAAAAAMTSASSMLGSTPSIFSNRSKGSMLGEDIWRSAELAAAGTPNTSALGFTSQNSSLRQMATSTNNLAHSVTSASIGTISHRDILESRRSLLSSFSRLTGTSDMSLLSDWSKKIATTSSRSMAMSEFEEELEALAAGGADDGRLGTIIDQGSEAYNMDLEAD